MASPGAEDFQQNRSESCLSGEVCRLRWDWDVAIAEVDDPVLLIPDSVAKNGQDRIVVFDRIARKAVAGERGNHPRVVLTYRGERISRQLSFE